MERVIITINGAYAAEKAEAVRQLIEERLAADNIMGADVHIERQVQVMPFMSMGRAERSNAYGEQICGSLCDGRKG